MRLEHFSALYNQARNAAMTSRNINAGWSKTGMFPWNPDGVVRGIQPLPGEEGHPRRKPVRPASYFEHEELLQTPITAVSVWYHGQTKSWVGR